MTEMDKTIEIDKKFDDSNWSVAPNEIPGVESFERKEDLAKWRVHGGRLSLSEKHYKHGNSSLRWDWLPGSFIEGRQLSRMEEAFFSEKGGMLGWVYNENAVDDDLVLEFCTETQLATGAYAFRLPFHLNYTGWRAFWFRFREDSEVGEDVYKRQLVGCHLLPLIVENTPEIDIPAHGVQLPFQPPCLF